MALKEMFWNRPGQPYMAHVFSSEQRQSKSIMNIFSNSTYITCSSVFWVKFIEATLIVMLTIILEKRKHQCENTQSVQASCWAVDCSPSVLCIVHATSNIWQCTTCMNYYKCIIALLTASQEAERHFLLRNSPICNHKQGGEGRGYYTQKHSLYKTVGRLVKPDFIANAAASMWYTTYTPYEDCLLKSTWNVKGLGSSFVVLPGTRDTVKSPQTHNALSGKSAVIGTGLPSWVGKGLAA